MTASIDDLGIINEALARLGSSPIASMDDDTKTASKVVRIYPTVVASLFDAHRWNFARRTIRLDQLNTVPMTGYARAFALPGNRIGTPVKVLTNPRLPRYPLREFAIEGDELHCDVEAVWATCTVRVPPEGWPPAFLEAAVVALAAELCVPQTHDTQLAQMLEAKAWGSASEGRRGGLVGRAMARDAASSPGPAPLGASDVLTDAWHGGC